MTSFWAERTLDGDGVRIDVAEGRIIGVTAGVARPPDATCLPGLTLPGLANGHSHAFHRALRGRTSGGGGTFWTWRDAMYELAERLDPDTYLDLARATYAEMALSGITSVGEFNYLHHQREGQRYEDPNEMGAALIHAAADAGLRLTLLDTVYLQAGMDGAPLHGPQRRFGDGDVAGWMERVSSLQDDETVRVGAAVHSVRAVPIDAIAEVAAWTTQLERPLHVHVSEQPKENEECLAATGRTPTGVLADAGGLGPGTTAVHATHLTDADIGLLRHSHVCFCPTTERDLADGIGPADRLIAAGAALTLGSDSHAVIDLFEEARAVELDLRLATGIRGNVVPERLLAATSAASSLGWDAGRIEVGQLADLTTVSLDGNRVAGAPIDASLIFTLAAGDVSHVVVGGRVIVEDGHHVVVDDVAASLRLAIDAVWS